MIFRSKGDMIDDIRKQSRLNNDIQKRRRL